MQIRIQQYNGSILSTKKVIFVPTPGQTEQEYLAEYYKEKYSISFFKQGEIDLKKQNFNLLKEFLIQKKAT